MRRFWASRASRCCCLTGRLTLRPKRSRSGSITTPAHLVSSESRQRTIRTTRLSGCFGGRSASIRPSSKPACASAACSASGSATTKPPPSWPQPWPPSRPAPLLFYAHLFAGRSAQALGKIAERRRALRGRLACSPGAVGAAGAQPGRAPRVRRACRPRVDSTAGHLDVGARIPGGGITSRAAGMRTCCCGRCGGRFRRCNAIAAKGYEPGGPR